MIKNLFQFSIESRPSRLEKKWRERCLKEYTQVCDWVLLFFFFPSLSILLRNLGAWQRFCFLKRALDRITEENMTECMFILYIYMCVYVCVWFWSIVRVCRLGRAGTIGQLPGQRGVASQHHGPSRLKTASTRQRTSWRRRSIHTHVSVCERICMCW